jgi:predicted PurR-regulated permease PerM
MPAGIDPKSGLRWVTLVLCAASLWLCWPLWPPLVLAAWTAALLRPLMTRIERRLHGRRAGAAVLTSLVGLLAATPLVFVAVGVIAGVRDLAVTIASAPSAEGLLEHIAIGGEDSAQGLHMPRTFGEGLALAQTYGREAFALLSDLAGAAATAVLMLVVYFGAAFALMRRGAGEWDWIMPVIPLRRDHIERFVNAFEETGRGLLIGVGLTCATQGAIALITYLALGVPQAWVLGPVTGIAAVIPVVGSALIWGPIALGLLLADHHIKAVVLLVIGVAVIGTVDNLLRPVFSRLGMLRLPMVVLFVSAVGGLLVLGAWGAVLGPLVVRLTLEALRIQRGEDAEPQGPSETA